MMNAIKKLIISTLVLSCGCTDRSDSDKIAESTINNRSSVSTQDTNDYIHHADSTFFSLDILNNKATHNYLIDRNKKCCIVITEEIQSLDKFFSHENIVEAIKYYRTNNNDPEKIGISIITTISIKKNDESFENICFFSNSIYVHEDGTFGISEFEMKLNDTLIKTKNGATQKNLQVIIKPDESNKRTYLMNFAYNQNSWKLVSKERYSNSSSDIENGERYCIDTTNNCRTSEKGVEISYECLLNLGNRICN